MFLAVAAYFSVGVAIRYVLPVLQIMSYFIPWGERARINHDLMF